MLGRFLTNYVARHQNLGNQLFHLVGLPVTFILPIVLLVMGKPPLWALASFIIGYILQFIGHAIEGNDAGEVIVVKKMLGKPYIEFGPTSKNSSGND